MKINPEGTYYIGYCGINAVKGKELVENIKEVKGTDLDGFWDNACETKVKALKKLIKEIQKGIIILEAKDENS